MFSVFVEIWIVGDLPFQIFEMLDKTFVNNLLLDVISREEFLAKYKPFNHLNYAGSHRGNIFIKDNQRNLISEIIYKDELLYCNSPDSTSDCDHTRFATSLIDVAKYTQ